MIDFKQGFDFYKKSIKNIDITNQANIFGGHYGNEYIDYIQQQINNLEKDINSFKGYDTATAQLKGDVAEFFAGDTLNIAEAIKGERSRAIVDRSKQLGSPDIIVDGNKISSKYIFDAIASAKAQSITIKEYCKKNHPNFTDEEILKYAHDHNYDNINSLLYDNQTRLIPIDQLEKAKQYLLNKINKESTIRPEQVQRYKDTLNHLTGIIKDNNGNESIPLSKAEAEDLARLAKDGNFNPKEWGLTLNQLIKFGDVINQSIKAGISSALFSLVIKSAPEIMKLVEILIKNGSINENELKEKGFEAIKESGMSFIKGFISCSIITYCKIGVLGEPLKEINPTAIGILTILAYDIIKNSYNMAAGKITKNEMENILIRETFVAFCSIGGGIIADSMVVIPLLMPFAFMLGSFAGSMIGAFLYQTTNSIFLSICANSGLTLFGLVEQDYTLPDEIFKKIGIDIYEFDKYEYNKYDFNRYEFDRYDFDRYEFDKYNIRILRRGVVGINKIGYI